MKAFRTYFMAAVMAATDLWAQTDVTATYLTDPSFEGTTRGTQVTNSADGLRGWNISAFRGWTVTNPGTQLLITSDCFTDNNFGKTTVADGTYALYQRVGWATAQSTISQTTGAVPAGEYQLKFKSKAFFVNNATSSGVATVSANGTLGSASIGFESGSTGCMAGSAWRQHTVRFTLPAEARLTLRIDLTWLSGGSCIALDDFRLISVPAGTNEQEEQQENPSPTEGAITHQFTDEATMMADLLQMLANTLTYARNIWSDCPSPNSAGDACGFFKANSAGQNNEDGVRTNADFSMICAFLYKYAQGQVTLPSGITWDEVRQMALKSLTYGYSTHKANRLKVTTNNAYWGSTSTSDVVWESSLWAMSLAYATYFLNDELTAAQKDYVYKMLRAECNYELNRTIPTGYAGDTKAEENGWEADVLAATLGLYPDDPLAQKWFERLRQFAINSYSQADDANDHTVIDPEYDSKTVADLYIGPNLYEDFTLQNHNYFHTSYQNVVIQELGEAALALQLFPPSPRWHTNALMHGNQAVMDNVLAWLALADGELAMPNGNDWSMFLFDQITSYSTLACFLRDPNALFLENMAYKYIKARQQTTTDGSWLLNSDIGPRRMGVQAHRVMMTWLMHKAASTADLQPATWPQFLEQHKQARRFTTQNIIRAASDQRFIAFSWSEGLKSYTGYFADTTPDRNKIICPYKANNTGNILGWYNVSGHATNATPATAGIYHTEDNAFTMNGALNTNDATLQNRFLLAATPGNAIIYLNEVKALSSVTVTGRRGGLLAISTDPFTRTQRTLYDEGGSVKADGIQTQTLNSPWVNIDQSVGIVTLGGTGTIGFGDRALSNSLYMSKLYPIYSNQNQAFTAGQVIDRSAVIYYSQTDAATTQTLQAQARSLKDQLPDGWNGLICADPDQTRYLVLTNFNGGAANTANLTALSFEQGAPVLREATAIAGNQASVTIPLDEQHAFMQSLRVFVKNADVLAQDLSTADQLSVSIRSTATQPQTATITFVRDGQEVTTSQQLEPESAYVITLDGQQATAQAVQEQGTQTDVTAQFIANPNFEEDETWGTSGSITLNGTTYNPCFTQGVAAADAKFPQVLPVKGWTAENGLTTASNYALLYSMPYSFSQYCVSPSNLGNSASIMSVPAFDADACRKRCLSILNSWTGGTNAISQSVSLPEGMYMVTFDMRYACANESRRLCSNSLGTSADIITTTGGNVNTSLCGITYEGHEEYVLPTTADTWERQQLTFTLPVQTDVTFRFGLHTSAGQGAANNTRLYVDNLQLFQIQGPADRVPAVGSSRPHTGFQSGHDLIHDLSGRVVSPTQKIRPGVYVTAGRKVCVR